MTSLFWYELKRLYISDVNEKALQQLPKQFCFTRAERKCLEMKLKLRSSG